MNIIVCDKCGAKLKVKPGLLKVMKSIRCVKCGNAIKIAAAKPDAPTEPPPETPAAASAPPPEVPAAEEKTAAAPAETSAPPAPAEPPPADPVPAPEPAPEPPPPPAPETPPAAPVKTAPDPAVLEELEKKHEARLEALEKKHAAQVEELTIKLRAAEQEVTELSDRVTSLQELWHSKEQEARGMLDRARRAEEEAAEARKMREDFLGRVKQELALFLVEEREQSLKRFSELETRLMQSGPGRG